METSIAGLSGSASQNEAFWKGFEAERAKREARRKAWAELEASGLLYTSPEAWASAKAAAAEAAAEAASHRNPVKPKKERTRYSVSLGRGTSDRVSFKPGMLDWFFGWLARNGTLFLYVWATPDEWSRMKAEIEGAQGCEIPQDFEGFMSEPQAKPRGQISRKSEGSWGAYEIDFKACPEMDMAGLLVALGMERFRPNYGQEGSDVIRMKGHPKDLFYQLMDAGFRFSDQPQDMARIRGRVPPEYLRDFDDGLEGKLPDRFRETLS